MEFLAWIFLYPARKVFSEIRAPSFARATPSKNGAFWSPILNYMLQTTVRKKWSILEPLLNYNTLLGLAATSA